MPEVTPQASFNSGEWSPKLFARVDLAKYRSAAALLLNYFVDYRGGASTRPGTQYILQCFKSSTAVRVIPFQASFAVGYVLEFGDQYIRFFFDGAPILEATTAIASAAAGPPEVFTDNAHGYANGDWVFIQGNYYIIANSTTNTFTLTDLFGTAINTNPFTLPGTAARVYTIASPYAAADLAKIKFAQNVNELILTHPSYAPYVLTIITANTWTLLPITFGTTAAPPGSVVFGTTLGAGSVSYLYGVSSVDANGEESVTTNVAQSGVADIRTTAGTNQIGWSAAAGAVAYNVYKAEVSYSGPVSLGTTMGYIGTTTSLAFQDSNISPDYSQTPPIARNPFIGKGIQSVAITAVGAYTTVPTITFTGAASTIAASAAAVLTGQGVPTVGAGGAGYVAGDFVTFTNGVVLQVATIGGGGSVATWASVFASGCSPGTVSSGSTPPNPLIQLTTSGAGAGATANVVWGVSIIDILNPGAGYVATPTVTFSSGAATATATLGALSNGYPSVCGFFQQRLVLAAPTGAPSTFYMSQPGAYFNYNVSAIAQADDSITGTLVSGQLNTIKSMVPQTSGLLMFTDRTSWLINGGSNGSAVTPSALVANAQSFNGVSDVPPIIANFDVLYVQAKGSIVRDSAYNIYANVYTGTDISALASHLFYGYTVTEWAWAEEPFKLVWAIRSDGRLLNLTFLKEQEFVGWAHSETFGDYKSVCTVVENTATAGEVDAVYLVVSRTINGVTYKYIERVAERTFPNGVVDAWTVDCGIQYVGAPATSFSGAQFLAGLTVTGLADGQPITPFVMPATGTFTLPAASKVTVGIGYVPQLQTLPLEMGDPTVQGKVKKINSVDIRVADTLGLSIGPDFSHLVPMKDLIRGNVSKQLTGMNTSQVVTDLVNGDASENLGAGYTIPGQYCIQQTLPYPATILGVFPNVTVGDGDRRDGR